MKLTLRQVCSILLLVGWAASAATLQLSGQVVGGSISVTTNQAGAVMSFQLSGRVGEQFGEEVVVLLKNQSVNVTGAPPSTRATVQWNDDALEVVFDCDDANIVAAQQGADNIKLWKDDSVYLWLDPGHAHDASNAVMVQVSAGGLVCDSRGGDVKFNVTGAVAEASRTEKGWRASLKLPWTGLGVRAPKAGDVWGVNVSRMDQPGQKQSSWAELNAGNLLDVDRWEHLVFGEQAVQLTHAARARQLEEQAREEALRVKRHQEELAARWGKPANPKASEATRQVLKYLASLTDRQDKRVLLAQDIWSYDKGGMDAGFDRFVKALRDKSGKWLPMLHVSYGDATTQPGQPGVAGVVQQANQHAIAYWKAGGLVTIHSNPKNPWTGKANTDLTGREKLPNLIKPGTPENLVWMKQLDAYAELLTELRDAGVVVLWRPLHEMTFNKCYFYDCGAYPSNPEVFKELWRHMFNYFTKDKKLDNLLWVYSVADVEGWGGPSADSVYPGGDYVDIVGISLYGNKVEVGGQAYEKLTALGKPFAFSEFGPGHADNLKTDGGFDNLTLIRQIREKYPKTIYAAYWHSWTGANMSIVDNPHATELLNDPWIVSRDDLKWRTEK